MADLHSFSLAIWRYPKQKSFSAILSFDTILSKKLDLQSDVGFAVAPFLNSDRKAFFIPADVMIHENEDGGISVDCEEGKWNRLTKLLETLPNSTNEAAQISEVKPFLKSKHDFTTGLSNAIKIIQDKKLKKVVLSRRKEIPLSSGFSVADSLYEMGVSYPSAFISYVSSPCFGSWIGATPEVLLSIKDNRYFKTVSLAGTQLASDEGVKEAVWKQKEIEEQALVSRYIIDCLKKIRLREYEDIGPRTIQAGNLFHLCTDFYVDMKEANFPELGNVMLELLHPTSAVCGMPKEEALAFIMNEETFDRELYSGYLGPINIDNYTHLAVNLRCAKLSNGSATLFAGVGITADSEPEKEWLETEMKFKTMDEVLN